MSWSARNMPASKPARNSFSASPSNSYKEPDLPQIPPRDRESSTSGYSTPSRNYGALSSSYQSQQQDRSVSIDQVSESEKARIVRRHLPSAKRDTNNGENPEREDFPVFEEERSTTPITPRPETGDNEQTSPVESYHKMLGGDVTHDLYKYASDQKQRPLRRPRSVSFTESPASRSRRSSHGSYNINSANGSVNPEENEDPILDIRNIRQPGGFRRNYLLRKQAEDPSYPKRPEPRFTRSFVDFLSLYGHFGGEELEEIDEEDEEFDEESTIHAPSITTERDALLSKNRSVDGKPQLRRGLSRRRSQTAVAGGEATVPQTVLMLLKGFVGTGILFLGKAFFNGGLIFSTVVLITIALISLGSFMLLIKTRLVIPGSFGDMGGILYGPWMRNAILFSIALSQIGFVSAYTIFVAQNLQAFILAVSNCKTYLSITILIFIQLVVFLPLAMIRNIQKLSGTALIADVFILLGLFYIFGNEIKVIAEQGVADVAFFNSKDFPLLIGTAVFTFEGIGLIIPITESMKEPQKFPKLLTYCMFGLMTLFAGSGVLSYMAYGSDIQTVVIVNLPQEDKFVNAVQFLYSLAIMLSTPLQLFPAVRIMENGLFSRSGKNNVKVKWEKNVFRAAVTTGCTVIAALGASDLDKFVSIVGSLACVPLCFCYPAMLHYKGCAKTRLEKSLDILLFLFGAAACIFCTVQTVRLFGEPGKPPKLGGKCAI